MNLSKNEQIALFIVVFLVVGVAGFFIFLRPAISKLGPNLIALVEKQNELDELEELYGDAAFTAVGQQIMDAYNSGVDASKTFHEEEYPDYEVDRLIKSILAEVKDPELEDLPLDNLLIYRLSTNSLQLSLYTPNEVMYPI
ncbi:MAG: hypothetical protein FWG45_06410, partial [Oscillospiraceae bacterium]|nr:hypothetical protein [Oscillospiraceae bacterium]